MLAAAYAYLLRRLGSDSPQTFGQRRESELTPLGPGMLGFELIGDYVAEGLMETVVLGAEGWN